MPRPPSKPKSPNPIPRDSKQRASKPTSASLPPEDAGSPKDLVAVALGRLGGAKEGKAQTAKLTPAQRRELARRAARSKA